MDRTETIRLKNLQDTTKEHVYVHVFWEGGSRTFGPLTLAARTGEIANVLPPKFANAITWLRFNWTVEGKPRRQEVRVQSEYFFASLALEWETDGRRQLVSVECQKQEMLQLEIAVN